MNNDWSESNLTNGFMVGLGIRGSSWNQAIANDPDLDFFPFIYDESEEFKCLETGVEGPEVYAYESPHNYAVYPIDEPYTHDLKDWISKYLDFLFLDLTESERCVFRVPVEVNEPDGFYIFAVGFPFENMGFPRVEVFYSSYTRQGCEHFTWKPDDPADWIFQEGLFMYKLIKELKRRGK